MANVQFAQWVLDEIFEAGDVHAMTQVDYLRLHGIGNMQFDDGFDEFYSCRGCGNPIDLTYSGVCGCCKIGV